MSLWEGFREAYATNIVRHVACRLHARWPEDIAGFPDCEELISQVNGDVVFRGPRFACGLASGRVSARRPSRRTERACGD